MRLFGTSRNEKPLMSIERVGATLDSCARIGMSGTAFLEEDQQYLQPINTLIYFTKSVIIMNSLRTHNPSISNSSRVKNILSEFERLTFLSLPLEGTAALADLFTKLFRHMCTAEEIAEDLALANKEASRKKMLWSKEWLGFMSEDENFLKRMALIYGLPLFSYLHGSIQLLGESVKATVLGEELE